MEEKVLKLKEEYENGNLKESDMSEQEKEMLINWYEEYNKKLLNTILEKREKLYKRYSAVKVENKK